MPHRDDIPFVLADSQGNWLEVKTTNGQIIRGAEAREVQREIQGRKGLNRDTPVATARNTTPGIPDTGVPTEFYPDGTPWIPKPVADNEVVMGIPISPRDQGTDQVSRKSRRRRG